jgi:hypothetical protein
LAWTEGEVLRLATSQDREDFFFRLLEGEIGKTQSGTVGENRLEAQTTDVGLVKFRKCFFHRERGEAGIVGQDLKNADGGDRFSCGVPRNRLGGVGDGSSVEREKMA